MFKKSHKIKYNKGLTLIELIVVISIFLILTGITIFDYVGFKSSVALNNLADDIALSVRKTQSYAIGARSSASQFTNGYGIHFSSTSNNGILSGNNKSFVIFADINQSNGYDYTENNGFNCGVSDPKNPNECIEMVNITSSASIKDVTYNIGGSSTSIGNGSMDVVFNRPNPDARFCYKSSPTSSNCSIPLNSISSVKITVQGVADKQGVVKTKSITISNTGLISVE